ncbi:MAG: hypothetical protein MR646_12310 [Agathobacter sp.]|nr:hypothetical protein [Agathobacter sp.]MDY4894190.1 hypothetical protein [Agathobacter sp.]
MLRMYDFGAEYSNVSVNERRAIAWPVAVWSCYIPESETQKINILESLILQMVHKGFKNPKETLCNAVGFNKDLVDAAVESCRRQGFFDWRHKELQLSEKGIAVLGKIENPYAADLEASKETKKIFMIQDLVTKSVIPVFDIEKLPDSYFEDEKALEIHYRRIDGKNQNTPKPKSASVKTALRYWAKLCNNIRHGIAYGTNTVELSNPPKAEESVEDFIPFEDEVEWDSIQEDGNVAEEVTTLADKEAAEYQQKSDKEVEKLTILDDSPELYYARGFIAINRSAPDEIIIISPFGSRLDNWFRTVINRLRASDEDFEEEIQFFLEEKKESLKDVIAFGNDLNITLFDEYPFICNNPEFSAVKKQIERLTISRNRILDGEDDSITFAQVLRSVYEASLRLVAKKNRYLFEARKLCFDAYKYNLRCLVDSYSFLSEDVYREYSGYGMYNNMTKTSEEGGYATAFFALILVNAWEDKNSKSMDLLRNIPTLPVRLKELTSNLKRNKQKKGQGAAASHGGDDAAELKLSVKTVQEQYSEFENLFRAIYNRFMEET